jgi:glycosyl transferase family 25
MFEAFDKISIISLPHRTDRRKEMREQLRNVGLESDPRVEFFDAVRPAYPGRFASIGAHGCYASHLEILKANRGSAVLILEDDCDFAANAADNPLPAGCDIFYGGYLWASEPEHLETSRVIVGSHCMGLSAKASALAADYLDALIRGDLPPDPIAAADPGFTPGKLAPIDGSYVWFRRAHPELKTVFADPQIAFQRPSRTDIGDQKLYDRLPVIRSVAELARRLKGRKASRI